MEKSFFLHAHIFFVSIALLLVQQLLGAMKQQFVHLLGQHGHGDALIRLVRIVGVETDQIQSGHRFAVLVLQDGLVDVELERVMPKVAVGHKGDAGRDGRLVAKGFVGNFLGTLPVVNLQRSVGIFKDHVDGSGQHVFFVKDHPLGAKRLELGEIRDKLEKVAVLDRVILHGQPVPKIFNVGVHLGPGLGGGVAVPVPLALNVGARHFVVLVRGIALDFALHAVDDGVGIKVAKVAVIPSRHGSVPALAVNVVEMRALVKGDGGVSGVGIFLGQHIESVKVCVGTFMAFVGSAV